MGRVRERKDYAEKRGERVDTLLRLLREGNFRECAAAKAGITDRTLRNWVAWGEEEHERYTDEWGEIRAAVLDAEADAEIASVTLIRSGSPDWKAHAWWLERSRVTRWGQKRTYEELREDRAAEAAAAGATAVDIDAAAVEQVLAKPELIAQVIEAAAKK